MEENEDIASVYLVSRRQIILGEQGRVMDIDLRAVKVAMDLYEVKDQRECLDRVRRTFYHFMGGGETYAGE